GRQITVPRKPLSPLRGSREFEVHSPSWGSRPRLLHAWAPTEPEFSRAAPTSQRVTSGSHPLPYLTLQPEPRARPDRFAAGRSPLRRISISITAVSALLIRQQEPLRDGNFRSVNTIAPATPPVQDAG